MVRSSRFVLQVFGAAGLAVAVTGCSLTPKIPSGNAAKLPPKSSSGDSHFKVVASSGLSGSQPVTTTSATRPPEFSTSDKPNDPVKLHLAYAIWHEEQGNLVEARNSYNKVLEMKTGSWLGPRNSNNIDAILGLARLDIATHRMDDAHQRLLKAQSLEPKNPQVAITLGRYYSARGDLPQALDQMKAARVLAPYDVGCAYHLGLVQAQMGDIDSALASFTEAIGAAEAQYNLGYILYGQGNYVAAEEHLKKAIAIKPNLAQAQSLLVTARQQRANDNKPLVARARGMGSANGSESGIQPASYTEFARPARDSRPMSLEN